MHNRQTGAAHVPIMFFLLLLIMFLAATGLAWMNLTKNNELTTKRQAELAELEALRGKLLLCEHYIVDIGNVVAKPGKYEGREVSRNAYAGATLDGIAGVMSPEEVAKVMDKALATVEQAQAKGLENVLGSMTGYVASLKDRIRDIESKRDEALATQSKTADELRKKSSDFETKSRWYSDELARVRSELEASHSRTQATLAATSANVETIAREKLAVEDAAAAKEKELTRKIEQGEHHLAGIQQRETLRKPPSVADGTVIAARKGLPTAFINIGRKDLLQSGTVFHVRAPNSSLNKAKATVVRVEDDRAEVELSNLVDPVADYVRDGDQLYNDIYSPGVVRTIFLMGRFSEPYHKPALTALLRRLGNKVVDKMGPGVDLVILGNDPKNEAGDGFAAVQESADYKEAVRLRVEFATLATIHELIRL